MATPTLTTAVPINAPPTPSSTLAFPPNPSTPAYPDGEQWITGYLVIHMLSHNSFFYAYLLWFIVAFIFLVFTLLHWSGSRGGFLGAHWSKWALRRRTWRGKHTLEIARRKGKRGLPLSLPPNGQLLCLLILLITTLLLAFAGPDYISPTIFLFHRRHYPSPTLVSRANVYDPSFFYKYQPQYTIAKAWWTSGGRTGLIAFALFPLCVLFALKAPPFAIFALPFTTQIHFDKLAWLHRWSGRLIWILTALHVALWSVQLGKDRRPGTGKSAYTYAWHHDKFIYGWVAFALLTALLALSISPLRKRHYNVFYAFHILLVPLTLIMAALHHPPVWWWCWSALGLWMGERIWRGTWWLHTNGFFGKATTTPPPTTDVQDQKVAPEKLAEERSRDSLATLTYPPSPSPFLSNRFSTFSEHELFNVATALSYSPPSGYAHAELLSGATVRLTFITPGYISWAPGQHFLINIPSVSRLATHPFTSASICDEQSPSDAGRVIVFLVRAKRGWTKNLWNHVASLCARGENHVPGETPPHGTIMPGNGVLLKMYVDGPFGSSVRAQWGKHSTVLIVVGGSGVSFGLSILEYVCLCLAGRDGKHLGGHSGGWGRKGFLTRRVRFVWLVREYGHIQWCASILRRCTALIPAPGLEVNIFVTNLSPSPSMPVPHPLLFSPLMSPTDKASHLVPPSPRFSRKGSQQGRDSISSADSDTSADSLVDPSYYTTEGGDEEQDISDLGLQESYTLDLTNFEGDNEESLPGEEALNRRVMKFGKARRAKSRKAEKIVAPRREFEPSVPRPQRARHHYQRHDRQSSTQSMDGLLSWPEPDDGHRLSRSSIESDLRNQMTVASEPPWHLPHGPITPPSFSPPVSRPPSRTGSPRPTAPHAPSPLHPVPLLKSSFPLPLSRFVGDDDGASSRPMTPLSLSFDTDSDILTLGHDGHPRLQVNEQEMRDVSIVSEHARPGKPRLDRILYDEVQSSTGSIIVACCGPTSLNAMVRKSIAAQIDPARILRGDRRGFIDLVSEEFEY